VFDNTLPKIVKNVGLKHEIFSYAKYVLIFF